MSLDDDLESLAATAVSEWPEIAFSGRLEAAIRDLFRTHLPFPASWTPNECLEFIEEQADTDAQRLATQFDDAIDAANADFGRQNGYLPLEEDASAMIAEARKDAVYELEASIDHLAEDLAQRAIHSAGRAVASMTGCSLAARRSRNGGHRRFR